MEICQKCVLPWPTFLLSQLSTKRCKKCNAFLEHFRACIISACIFRWPSDHLYEISTSIHFTSLAAVTLFAVYSTTSNSIWLLIWILRSYLYEASKARFLARQTFPLCYFRWKSSPILIICLHCSYPIWFTPILPRLAAFSGAARVASTLLSPLTYTHYRWNILISAQLPLFLLPVLLIDSGASHPFDGLSMWRVNGFE